MWKIGCQAFAKYYSDDDATIKNLFGIYDGICLAYSVHRLRSLKGTVSRYILYFFNR